MNYNSISRSLAALILIVLASSFSYNTPAKKFTPVGTWEYTLVGVPPEYESGTMTIEKKDKSYTVTMATDEYNKAEATDVEYKKKKLKFSLSVESENIKFSGTFDKDTYTGTLSFSEGEFDMKATRKKEK